MSAVKERVTKTLQQRAIRSGKLPREAYGHYFIETEGLHSRIHLQNFWSTFWPDHPAATTATIQVRDRSGRSLGVLEKPLPKFGQLFLEMRDVLSELGSDSTEGSVAVDLRPPESVTAELPDLPKVEDTEINTPFWMAYYDADENYMYVHSIEKLRGEHFGTSRAYGWLLDRTVDQGERWRSWRLLDAARLSEIQIVVVNHSPVPRATRAGLYGAAPDSPALLERPLEFGPHELHRIRFSADEIAAAVPEGMEHVRIGVDPLLTHNGKPYVLMRYGDGPLSLHHG
jgi:hypothetical protein